LAPAGLPPLAHHCAYTPVSCARPPPFNGYAHPTDAPSDTTAYTGAIEGVTV